MEQKGHRIFHMTVNSVKCSRGFRGQHDPMHALQAAVS
jgi:hypothetical protein